MENLGIYDLTDATLTQNITPIFNGESSVFWFFTNNTNNDLCRIYNPGNSNLIISFYEFSNNQIGNKIGDDVEVMKYGSNNLARAILKYKDTNNRYRIFISCGAINSSSFPSFIMIDCYSRNINEIFSKLNNSNEILQGELLEISLTEVGNYKYLLSGMALAVFDENWNLVGNAINRLETNEIQNNLQQILLYDGDIYDFSEVNDSRAIGSAIKHKTWLNKLTIYERQSTINGNTKQLTYFAIVNSTDLDSGYYDE